MVAVTVKLVGLGLFGVLLIVSITLVAVSFKRTGDAQACILTDTYSGETDRKPITEATVKFGSPASKLICYPTSVQRMTLSNNRSDGSFVTEGLERTITARTAEGLEVDIAAEVDYRIVPDRVDHIILKYGTRALDAYIRIARSELRNAGSLFTGRDYLGGERVTIGNKMKEQLQARYDANGEDVTVLHVNLLHIAVAEAFEDAFRLVETLELDRREELENRVIATQNETRANQTQYNALIAEQQRVLVAAESDLSKAILANETAYIEETTSAERRLTEAATERIKVLIEERAKVEELQSLHLVQTATANRTAEEARLAAGRARSVALVNARAELEVAQATQLSALAVAETELQRVAVEQATRLAVAEAAAARQLVAANATALAIQLKGEADADVLEKRLAGEQNMLESLPQTGKLTHEQALQYRYMGAVQELGESESSTMFIDYSKQPLLAEAGATAGTVTV